ncbi:Folliculin-interacting protein 2 [Nymphon striatum]|nr:Folliculin-interacting protein 2 [Nymphon striatum]
MAPLLSRLFNSRKSSMKHNSDAENSHISNESWKSADFNMDQIRVLFFRECDRRGRKLLFDSKSIKVIPPHDSSPQSSPSRRYIRILTRQNSNAFNTESLPPPKLAPDSHTAPNGTVYQYLRPPSDAKMLGEMIFGSVAMSYKGSTMKIHTIRSPSQLMLSEVFPASSKPREYDYSDSNLEDSCNLQSPTKESCSRLFTLSESWKSNSSVAHSLPVDVPDIAKDYTRRKPGDFNESFDSIGSNMNYANSPDGYSSSNSSLTHSSSFSSLHRRWLRNRATSFENGWKRNSDQDESGIREQSRIKLGIALVITLPNGKEIGEKHFREFFFTHITLMERHFKVLQADVANAYFHRKHFVHQVMQALFSIRSIIYDLYKAPRVTSPAWLTFLSQELPNQVICQKFIYEFSELVEECDTKNTNFFISSLLTAVLTHHLSWVPTITPSGVPNRHSYHQKQTAKWLDVLAKSHPYNPLWVQLEDLYGILGHPKKVTRTVVLGKRRELVLKLLFILTYFIRCSELKECFGEIDTAFDGNLNCVPQFDMLQNIAECVQSCNIEKDQRSSDLMQSDPIPVPVPSSLTTCQCKNSSDPSYQCKCSSNTLLCDSLQNKFKMLATEKKLVLSLNTKSNSNNVALESVFTGADDVFISRTPDLDSGISEESAEDSNNINSQASPPNPNNAYNIFPGPSNFHFVSTTNPNDLNSKLSHIAHQDSKVQNVSDLDNSVGFRVEDSGLFESGCSNDLDINQTVTNIPFKFFVDSPSDDSVNGEETNTEVDNESASTNVANDPVVANQLNDSPLNAALECVVPNSKIIQRKNEVIPSTMEQENVSSKNEIESNPITAINDCISNTTECHSIASTNQSEDEPNDPHEIEVTSQLLKEYWTIRNEFKHNVSLFDKNPDENEAEKYEDSELKICDAKNKFYTRSESISKSDQPNGCKQNCECFMCKNRGSLEEQTQFKFDENCDNISSVEDYTLNNLAEIPLPRSKSSEYRTMKQCFGQSLYASYTDHYMPDFCLQGISQNIPEGTISQDLSNYMKHSNYESITEAICIVADTDNWSVHIESSNEVGVQIPTMSSQLVSSMTESLLQISKLKFDPDYCLMHLEDRLQELYFKSILLKEYMSGCSKEKLLISEMSSTLRLDPSDIPLLLSVASTHSPRLVPPLIFS